MEVKTGEIRAIVGGADFKKSKFNGPITRAYALSHSNNIVTIKTLLDTAVHNVIDVAKRCRLSGPYFPYPSLALGCIDATLKEAAGGFNMFFNNWVLVGRHFFLLILY